jgi:hypothetical protein
VKAFLSTEWDAGYGLAPRAPNHGWLHAADVPAEVTGSAHCHNFAATRRVLWDRLGAWAGAAAEHLSGGAALAA